MEKVYAELSDADKKAILGEINRNKGTALDWVGLYLGKAQKAEILACEVKVLEMKNAALEREIESLKSEIALWTADYQDAQFEFHSSE